MKLSDYIANFISDLSVKHVFAINGGASLHIIDSIYKHDKLRLFCPHHEQASAMAADAYSRVTENIGVAVSTSGPGATNMITGICCSWYDSVPLLLLTGQVSTFRLKKNTGVRQQGFQETSTVEMVSSICKYATMITDPNRIRYELEKAVYIAKSGRPGPVLLDIPDNIYREEITPEELEGYPIINNDITLDHLELDECIDFIKKAERPVLILGWGVHLSNARSEAKNLIQKLKIPVLLTWALKGLISDNDPLFAGTFGTHGTRYGNLAVQNADLIISVGSRLDTHEVGSPISSFARNAKKVIIDIDQNELNKFETLGLKVDCLIQSDAKNFIQQLNSSKVELNNCDSWKSIITQWKSNYHSCPQEYYKEKLINPYVFVNELANYVNQDELIVSDTGCGLAWLMQGFPILENQKIIHAFNNTPMGYALPASIGASLALENKQITCVTGDGALMMNIQELINISKNNLNIKIILINNHGYSMICQTQDQWLDSDYSGSDENSGLAFPDFEELAKAHGFKVFRIEYNEQINNQLDQVYKQSGPVFCNVEIKAEHRVVPQVKYGYPIEDPEPLLERTEFLKNMIIEPMPISRKTV